MKLARIAIACLILVISSCIAVADTNLLSISLDTNEWNIGSVPVGGVVDTWFNSNGTFCVSNSGTVAAKIMISVTNSTPDGWVAGLDVGTNRFCMSYALDAGSGLAPNYLPVSTNDVVMTNGFATNETFRFDLQFRAPSGGGPTNVEQTIKVTISAMSAE